ncbi:MAG: HK97 gp10 family phage protein [Halopenitus sp.]
MFDAEINGFENTQSNLTDIDGRVVAAKDDATEAYAKSLLREIKKTAPVDTGEYKNDWRIEERDSDPRGDVFIVNSTLHGPYLVFPNQKMVGSEKADDPSRGIIHNVRGIVQGHKMSFKETFASYIQNALF